MYIPLDYYRILGIFPQVTDEQITQAYRDRSVQLPRREYSPAAIATRKQLLAQAYNILSKPEQKKAYDSQFLRETLSDESIIEEEPSKSRAEPLEESSSSDTIPGIDITPEQLVGVLLIFQELGEYELVLQFGQGYLDSLPKNVIKSDPTRPDIILTVALAFLELSRERWQHEQYEQAAVIGIKALTLLEQNSLFPSVQAEIHTELDKLRPYRILELLAESEDNEVPRNEGKQLLQKMLQERQGIDGRGNDRSGLNINDFLRFIQQIRTYLTAQEQQELFMAESQRPSAVAAYLAVYALIARGFAHKQPSLILEAQTILNGLGDRQDVSLEQAICSLLLGQTQTATLALEKCQDTQALSIIKENSQGSPDLLPGLCLYSESWLKTEVFSHCRDLITQKASLKEYFANQEVQSYLEQLSWESQEIAMNAQQEQEVSLAKTVSRSNQARVVQQRVPSVRSYYQQSQAVANGGGGVAALLPSAPISVDFRASRRRRDEKKRDRTEKTPQKHQSLPKSSTNIRPPQTTVVVPPSLELSSPPTPKLSRTPSRRRKQGKIALKPSPWLLGAAGLAILGLVGLSVQGIGQLTSPLSALEDGQYEVFVHQPLIDIPAADAQIILSSGLLTSEGA
ncbi:J domain-containing protein [Aphanothece sacrum]|nr:J domain-containing protein [Aphanothece sacrum]